MLIFRHVGLVHRKLDEMLGDSELVAKKMAEFNGSPTAMSVTKVEPVRKSYIILCLKLTRHST